MDRGHALARDELIRVLTAYTGITTGIGGVGGTTIVDANLINNPLIVPAAIPEKTILIGSGPAAGEDKGAASFNNVTGAITLQGTGFSVQIPAGTIYRILNISSIEIDVANIKTVVDAILVLVNALDITTFTQESVAATDVNGTTWKDLLDKSTITKPTKICGFKVTVAGAWAGNAKIRITDGAGNKIFPFQNEYVEGTEFTSGAQVIFNFAVVVPVADGYKFQFRSTNAGDGAGETLALDNLDVIEVGA